MIDTLSYFAVDFIHSLGVKKIFMVPGGGNMFLVDAVGRHKGIEVISTHNEQSAVIAAEAYSRIGNNLGVALVTSGPGATNSVTGIAGAWFDSIPLLIISGQVKRKDIKKENDVRQKGPQEIDIVSMVKNITKYAKTIKCKKSFLQEFKKAVRIACSDRPGPVLLDIPLDLQAAPYQGKRFIKTKIDSLKTKKKIESSSLELVINKIKNSRKPIFLLGQGIKSSNAVSIAKKLIQKSKVPFLLTWPMIDFLPFDHNLNMGRPGAVAKRFSNIIIQNCDLLISIGARLDRVVTAHKPNNFAKRADVICIDIDSNELKKHPKRFYKVKSDCKSFINALMKNCEFKNKNTEWHLECKKVKNYFLKNEYKKNKKTSIYEVIDFLSEILPTNSIIATGSSGLSIEAFYAHFLNKKHQKIFLTTGLGAMGYGFPSLVGINNLEKKLFLFESDGSAMMNLQELQTLKTINSKAKIFLINNKGYASIRNTQRNYFQGRYVGTTISSGLETPSISKLSKSLGINSFSCHNRQQMREIISANINKNQLILFEIFVQENENLYPKCSTHDLKSGNFISAPIEDMSPLLSIDVLKKFTNNKIDKLSERIRDEI